MRHQKQNKQRASTWREARAKAVKEGRVNEAALQANKRRMLAEEEHAHVERQQDDGDNDA